MSLWSEGDRDMADATGAERGRGYWNATASAPSFPRLGGDTEADVATLMKLAERDGHTVLSEELREWKAN